MMAIATPMNTIWDNASHKCHATGRMRWKSTLQNVTKRMKNINKGTILSKNGAKKVAAPSSAGVKAKSR